MTNPRPPKTIDKAQAQEPASSPRWRIRPPGSNWGDFGVDDQRGRLNLITPEKVRQGIAEVREGLTFCLSLPLDYPGGQGVNPRRRPPVLRPNLRKGRFNINYWMGQDDGGKTTDVMSDDYVVLYNQYSSQWDGFAHVGAMFDADGDGVAEPVYYNGYRAGTDVLGPHETLPADTENATSDARRIGVENMAQSCVQGRAVMIDLHAHYRRAPVAVGYDDLQRLMAADDVTVEAGDMVCLHTGLGEMVMEMGHTPDVRLLEGSCASFNGRDGKLLNWITDSKLSVLIADNIGVETTPALLKDGPCSAMPLHEHCLFKLGIHLAELWLLTPLANWLRLHDRSRFLLTAPPLWLRGAIGSPVTPVATV
jgi:kynurenine formamidase